MSTSRYHARTVQPLPAWGTAKAPPKEFRLFTLGETMGATWMGGRRESFVLALEGAQAIIAEWSRRNIEGAFDRDHDFGDSRGTFDIELRADGLWVVSIVWTPETLSLFAAKKLRYYSPAFDVQRSAKGKEVRDDKGRLLINALVNIALTNFPATDNLRPLISLSLSQKKGRAPRRLTMLTPEQALEKANEVIAACEGKPELADKVALLLMSEAPIEEAPIEEAPEMSADEAVADGQIAATARKLTGLSQPAQVTGALHQLAAARTELANTRKELAQIKHVAAVEQAIKERKLTPAKRDEALKQDPQFFAGFIALASPVVDDTVYTAKTSEPKEIKSEDLINDEMIAYCAKHGADVKVFAASYAKLHPGVVFASR